MDTYIILDCILVIISIIMLWKGADWLVDSASEIAHTLKVSDLIIGLTVVAFGTSAPEFAVTISAAITKQSDISIGNVIGSNIFNLGFILGGTAIIHPITTSSKLSNRDGGHLMVKHASSVAHYLGVSDWVIAVTIVAAGTSAPEFATSIAAALKGRHGIALGNLIGSDLFNLLGVLGLAGIINPTYISEDIYSSTFLLVIMVGITLFMIRTNWRISRAEGTILVVINLVRWYYNFAS